MLLHSMLNPGALLLSLFILSISLFQDTQEEAEADLQNIEMAVVKLGEVVSIVIDGIQVVDNLPSTAIGVLTLFGFIYALNHNYPKKLKNAPFEFFQKVIMGLESQKMSATVDNLNVNLQRNLV